MVPIHRDAKRRGTYLVLFIDPEGGSCFLEHLQSTLLLNFLGLIKMTVGLVHVIAAACPNGEL